MSARHILENIKFIKHAAFSGGTAPVAEVSYFDRGMNKSGHEQLPITTSPLPLASLPADAHYATIYFGPRRTPGAVIRWRVDASPSDSVGDIIENEGRMSLLKGDIEVTSY